MGYSLASNPYHPLVNLGRLQRVARSLLACFRMTDALEDPGAKWVAICGAVLNR